MKLLLTSYLGFIHHEFARLAFQFLAQGFQCGKPDGSCLVRFQHRQIRQGDTDAFRELRERRAEVVLHLGAPVVEPDLLGRPLPKADQRVAYGAGQNQFGELWVPATPGRHRGGSWYDSGRNCCSEIFIPDPPNASEHVGFRVAQVRK